MLQRQNFYSFHYALNIPKWCQQPTQFGSVFQLSFYLDQHLSEIFASRIQHLSWAYMRVYSLHDDAKNIHGQIHSTAIFLGPGQVGIFQFFDVACTESQVNV